MKILAIDPGYERIGIAIIEKPEKEKEVLLYSDCFKTPATLPFSERLSLIGQEISRVISKFTPTVLAIETLFFAKNQKTALGVAEARGVITYEAARHNLNVHEYTPLQVKMAIAGHGRGDKTDILRMLPKLITITKKVRHDDEYDAIAVGLTCSASQNYYKQSKTSTTRKN